MTKSLSYTILFIVLLQSTSNVLGQTTLKGYITQYEHGDTVVECHIYNRTYQYNKFGEEIHREWFSPSIKEPASIQKKHFMTVLNNSDDYSTGWIQGNNEVVFSYIHDTLNKRFYTLENSDTVEIYALEFDNKERLIRKECLDGCEFTTRYSYQNPTADTLTTIMNDGTVKYTITAFDSQHRRIYTKFNLSSLSDEEYDYAKYKYKDQVNMKIYEFGNTGKTQKKVTTMFSNKQGFLTYETLEIINGEDIIRWVIEYEEE